MSSGNHFWWFVSVAAVLFVLGLFLLLKARKIQEWAVRKGDNYPFQDYVESPTYLLQQRIVGVIALALSFFCAYAAWANR